MSVINRIERGAEKVFLDWIRRSSGKQPKRRTKTRFAIPSTGMRPKRVTRKKTRITAGQRYKYDPVIDNDFEQLPDGRVALWIPVRLVSGNDLKNEWVAHTYDSYVTSVAKPSIEHYLKGLDGSGVREVWLTQITPEVLFDDDNLNRACKRLRDLIARRLQRDDASHKDRGVIWRYMWQPSERSFGCLVLMHGEAVGGQYDRVHQGHVRLARHDGTELSINVRNELRDTA